MVGRKPSPKLRYYLAYDTDYNHSILDTFAKNLMDEVVSNPEGCTLPLKLGWLKVIGNRTPPKENEGAYVPMNGSKAPGGKKIQYDNFHTDGKTFKVYWYSQVIGNHESTVTAAFFNSDLYTFKAAHPFRRRLFTMITQDNEMWPRYHMKSTHRAVRTYFDKGRPKKGARRRPKPAEPNLDIEDYD